MSYTFAQDKTLRRALFLAAVLPWIVLGVSGSTWAQNYTFTTIDVPGSTLTEPSGINAAGQIVGSFSDSSFRAHGFLYSGGSFTIIDVPGSQPYGINNAGQIVGYFTDLTTKYPIVWTRGFLYSGGSYTPIDVPGTNFTVAFGINNAGQIVGYFFYATGGPHGFLYSGGSYTPIDVPVPGTYFTQAFGINDTGQIVGTFADAPFRYHGFLYSGGSFTIIDVPGSTYTITRGINAEGQIVGYFSDAPTREHGFLYSGGSFTIIDVPNSINTQALGINETGQIVGTFVNASGVHGFIATPVPTAPPVISITATPKILWPPNGKMVPVTISGTITDAESGVNTGTATYAVTDEYGLIKPSGQITTLDATNGTYTFTIQLQASRRGNDQDGREYVISISAQDNEGNEGSNSTIVTVPHDQR